MSEIKLTIDGTEYELEPAFGTSAGSTPILKFDGLQYIGKAIPKEVNNGFEIISFVNSNGLIYKRGDRDRFYPQTDDKSYNWCTYEFLLFEKKTINSVRRISDNQEFCLGDLTTDGLITLLREYLDFGMTAEFEGGTRRSLLSDLVKVKPKQVLLTTEDGYEKFEGDRCWYVNNKMNVYKCTFLTTEDLHFDKTKYFNKKEAADEYRLQNKPIEVSLKEMTDELGKYYDASYMFDFLNTFFKSKINP